MGTADAKAALWTLLGVFVAFKLATTAMIIAADPGGAQLVLGLFVAFHWPFILAGLAAGVVFLGMWLLLWGRLLRARARRSQLMAAEWEVRSGGEG